MDSFENLTKRVKEWFFAEGINRPDEHRLGFSGWLRRLYSASDELASCGKIIEQKKSIAFWGASQVGKSTLFASYIDSNQSEDGFVSAMQWSPSLRISYEHNTKNPDDTICWNPYNFNSDASACITRFKLGNSVKYIKCPVEIKFATREQITHSIAAGYLSECKLEELKNETVFWEDEKFASMVNKFMEPNLQITEQSFSLLFSTFKVLESLHKDGGNRYSNLKHHSCQRLLDAFPKVSSPELISSITSSLFWDEHPVLSEMWEKMNKLRDWFDGVGMEDCGIYCSFEVATLINDMASYQSAIGGSTLSGEKINPNSKIKDAISRLRYSVSNGDVLLQLDEGEPIQLQGSLEDFAILQGMVWEMTVILNRDHLLQNSSKSFYELLETSDLLDFPGVSREGNLAEDQRLSLKNLQDSQTAYLLFTKVLKRGKTACIGSTASMTTRIDSFCLLNKSRDQVASSDQLYHGVKNWWEYVSGEEFDSANTKSLPLNFILTFFSDLANDLITNPNSDKFSHSLEKLKALRNLVNPNLVNFFAVNYSKYGGFRTAGDATTPASETEILSAKNEMMENEVICKTFGENLQSIEEVFSEVDGGVEFLFSKLLSQMESENNYLNLNSKSNGLKENILAMLREALPTESEEDEKRKTFLEKEIDFLIQLKAKNTEVKKISQTVIDLTSITPESIPPIPSNLHQKPKSAHFSYLKTCLLKWKSEKTEKIDWDKLGFNSSDEFLFLLSLMESAFPYDNLASWITSKSNFGSISNREERNYARRFVCMAISEQLSGKSIVSNQPHTEVGECVAKIRMFNNTDEPDSSPYFYSVVEPFVKELRRIIVTECNVRGILPGDESLNALYSEYNSQN